MRAAARASHDHRPIYIQVAESLRARILSGYYADRLDGELRLADEFQLSRRTIQQAIEVLVGEGLLGRQQGTGTFINHQGVARRYRAITSITEGVRAQGRKVDYTILHSGTEPPTAAAQAFFRLGKRDLVYRHDRLILGDGRPVAHASTVLNARLLEGLELSRLDKGLYETLRRDFGRTIVHAEDSYRPVIADQATAAQLQLAEGTAIFLAERRAYDQAGVPIELSAILMLPVPLEISIAQIGAENSGKRDTAADPWDYRVGFGDFGA